jgi:hypothetical protein
MLVEVIYSALYFVLALMPLRKNHDSEFTLCLFIYPLQSHPISSPPILLSYPILSYFRLQIRPSQPVQHAPVLPLSAAAHRGQRRPVRAPARRHALLRVLPPAGELPAVPGGAAAEEAVVALPQEVYDVVPAARGAKGHRRGLRGGHVRVLRLRER